ncbi:LanC-like protein 2, partial [Perkinsus olseni]
LGCTVEMIREMRKDANIRAKLRAKLTGKRRSDDDEDDAVEASRAESDDSDDEGRAAIGRKHTKPPYSISSNGRYYSNRDLPDLVTDSDLSNGLKALLGILRANASDPGSIYVGHLGCLLTELALEHYRLHEFAARDWRAIIRHSRAPQLSSHRVTLLEGPGVAHRALLVVAGDHGAPLQELLDFSRTVQDLPLSNCEVLYGRAGYLSALLWIADFAQLSEESRANVSRVCGGVVRDIVDDAHWRGDHYHWEWHDRPYLGAAHGTAGIVYALCQYIRHFDPEDGPQLLQRLIATVSWVLARCRCSNGNIESSVGSRSGGKLVHWCHGATGWIPTLIQLSAAIAQLKPRDHEALLSRIREVLCSLGEVVYERGLLAEKGAGLCHGVGGSTMALIALYSHTGDGTWLRKARQFALFAGRYGQWLSESFADRPYSLYEGLAGATAAIAATLAATRGQDNVTRIFPGF